MLFRDLIPRFKQREALTLDGRVLSTQGREFAKKAELPPLEQPHICEVFRPHRDPLQRSEYSFTWGSSSTGRLETSVREAYRRIACRASSRKEYNSRAKTDATVRHWDVNTT
jgi:hypothetical protein